MSSKHTRYVRQIDIGRVTGGNVVVYAGGGGGAATPTPLQLAATDVIFAPAGNIGAHNVQSAIEELDDEKLGLAGGTMTGLLILSDHPTDDLGAATKWYVDNLDRLLVPDAAGVPVVRLMPDFIRIGHPLQPGLTWTMADGVRLPAVCVTGLMDHFTTYVAAPTGAGLAVMGAVHYIAAPTRLTTIAVAIGENTLGEKAYLYVLAAAQMVDLVGTDDAAVVGIIEIQNAVLSSVGAAEDYIIDEDTGEFVIDDDDAKVISGDDPLLPAGSWLGVWDAVNMDFLTNVTVTMFGRLV